MEKYDLTTSEGLKNAVKLTAIGYGNPVFLLYKLGEKLFSSDNTKEQSEVVEKLIKSGKEKEVDEMEIKIKNSKGFKFKVPLEEGVQIDTSLGTNEELIIKVKYK